MFDFSNPYDLQALMEMAMKIKGRDVPPAVPGMEGPGNQDRFSPTAGGLLPPKQYPASPLSAGTVADVPSGILDKYAPLTNTIPIPEVREFNRPTSPMETPGGERPGKHGKGWKNWFNDPANKKALIAAAGAMMANNGSSWEKIGSGILGGLGYHDQAIDQRNKTAMEREKFDYTKSKDERDFGYKTDVFDWNKDTDERDFTYKAGKDEQAQKNEDRSFYETQKYHTEQGQRADRSLDIDERNSAYLNAYRQNQLMGDPMSLDTYNGILGQVMDTTGLTGPLDEKGNTKFDTMGMVERKLMDLGKLDEFRGVVERAYQSGGGQNEMAATKAAQQYLRAYGISLDPGKEGGLFSSPVDPSITSDIQRVPDPDNPGQTILVRKLSDGRYEEIKY